MQTNTPGSVIIVIPAYNESATIAPLVREALRYFPVIVVDDGSADDTAAQVAETGATLVRHPQNRGKAAALWTGMQRALELGAETVITLDGDGQHEPQDAPRLAEAAQAQPRAVVVAARLRNREATPPLRLFGNRFANFWISWASAQPIRDSQSGYRAYPASLLRQLEPKVARERSFVFESEILIEAGWRGYRVHDITIEALYPEARRKSHYRPTLDTVRIVRMVAGRLLSRGMMPLGLLRGLGILPPR